MKNSPEAALLRSDGRGCGRDGGLCSGTRTREFRPEMSSDQVGDAGDAEQWSDAGCLVKAQLTGHPHGTA